MLEGRLMFADGLKVWLGQFGIVPEGISMQPSVNRSPSLPASMKRHIYHRE